MVFHADENTIALKRRLPILVFVVLVMVTAIFVRLFFLQVVSGEKYQQLFTSVTVRPMEVVASRGRILDRNGKVLADTRPYFEIIVTPQHMSNMEKVLQDLVKIVPLHFQEIQDKLKVIPKDQGFIPVVVAEDVPYDWVAKLSEYFLPEYHEDSPYDLSGVTVRSYALRRYLYPDFFSHALGYLREIDKKQLEKEEQRNPGVYSRGDLIGASGVESTYDIWLKGKDGQDARVVDARGREVSGAPELEFLREYGTIPPLRGYDLVTSLDYDAQVAAAEAFKDKSGAAIALDPQTGEVLVLYSSPGFDANRIMKNVDKKYWAHINKEPILYNNALQGRYMPGSTFKPVTLLTGIEKGVIDPAKTHFGCAGGLQFGNKFFKCWNKGGHGSVDAIHSLSWSCDVYYYNIGMKVDVDDIAHTSHLFNLGSRTGIDVPNENAGLIPTKEWKVKKRKEQWYTSENLSVSIGQSYVTVTPLQNAVMTAMIANDGWKITPHFGKKIQTIDGQLVREITYPMEKTEITGHASLQWLRNGMIAVVQEPSGTARRLKESPYKIAGKTGTAQNVGHAYKGKMTKELLPDGLFIAFAPYDNPRIAVSVVVKNGKGGALAAAPIAHKIIDAYLAKIFPEGVP